MPDGIEIIASHKVMGESELPGNRELTNQL